MTSQTPENTPKLAYGELPPHPIEAKMLREVPDGWELVQTVFNHELYEPIGTTTRAERLDDMLGADNWGLVVHASENESINKDGRLLDIVGKTDAVSNQADTSE
jgi:hypothetical protein